MKLLRQTLVLVTAFFLIACGGKKEKKKESFSYEKKSDATEKVEGSPNDVVLTSNDAMQFNKAEIRVNAGEKIKLTLKHIGKLDKKIMGHNFVLLKQGVNLTAFGNMAVIFSENDYIPKDTNDIIVHTKLIGGGESAVIEFDAPEVGTYEFLCSFPGHYGMMKGKFIVE